MNCYDQNMDCLKQKRPYFYDAINEYHKSVTTNELIEVYSGETHNHEHSLFVQQGDSIYRLNSIYNPSYEAKQWAEQFKFQDYNNVVFLFGLGNGIFLKSILNKLHSKDLVLVYEPSITIFSYCLHQFDLSDLFSDERLIFSIDGLNAKEFHFTLRSIMNVTNINSAVICNHPFYNVIFEKSFLDFWKEIKDCYMDTILNVNTGVLFGEVFIDNIIKNIEFLKGSNSLPELQVKIPKELPAILVAAGPSVEQNIEELKRAKGKAVIFAVDRILDYLLDSGVEPDFVVTLDPAKPIEYFTKREDVALPLITFMQSSHTVLAKHKGRKIFCNCSDLLKQSYRENKKEVPNTLSSPSVATVAFSICIDLGFKTIILVGQDLAYSGNVTHAGGEKESCGDHNDVMVEGLNGQQVKSRYDWKSFLTTYQDLIALNTQLTVIDTKEAGAKINGAIVLPLREAIDKYSTGHFQPEDFMNQFQPTFNDQELLKVKAHMEKNMIQFENIRKKAKDAIKLCESVIKSYTINNSVSVEMNDSVRKIGRINNFIRNQQLYPLIDLYVMSESIQEISELYRFSDDIQDDNRKTYERAKKVFEDIIKCVDYIKPRLTQAIETLV